VRAIMSGFLAFLSRDFLRSYVSALLSGILGFLCRRSYVWISCVIMSAFLWRDFLRSYVGALMSGFLAPNCRQFIPLLYRRSYVGALLLCALLSGHPFLQ